MKIDKCVLGVYETLDGLDIAGELCSWLKKHYKVYKVTQQPTENNLYEYPGLLMASNLSIGLNEPILYLHTKGAVNNYDIQGIVRSLWKNEFRLNKRWYEAQLDVDPDKPKVLCPITTGEEVAWYNGYIMNPAAAKIISERLKVTDREFYEIGLLKDCGIEVVGRYMAKERLVTMKMFEILGIKMKGM